MDSVLFAKASSERIEFGLGTIVGTGAITMAVIVKHTTITTDMGYCGLHSGAFSFKSSIRCDSGGNVIYETDVGGRFDTGSPLTTGNGWVLVAVGKNAGSSIPRVHILRYPTWRHANMDSALADATVATGFIVGAQDPGEGYLDGNVLIAGVWDSNLGDGGVETLALGPDHWKTAKEVIRVNAVTGLASSSFSGTMSESGHTGGTIDTDDVPSWWQDVPPTIVSKVPLFVGRAA